MSRLSVLWWCAWPAAALVVACGEKDPCLGLRVGDQLEITILGQIPGTGETVDCVDALELQDGRQLDVRVNGYTQTDMSCRTATIAMQPFGAWTWDYSGPGPRGGDFNGDYTATNGVCSGVVSLKANSSSLPSAPWNPGASNQNLAPPARAIITYHADEDGFASCPNSCAFQFGIDVRRR